MKWSLACPEVSDTIACSCQPVLDRNVADSVYHKRVRAALLRISIVTPSYQQGRFLAETIQSVIGQNYPNLEYFVFDGGSSDCTLKVLREYDKHLTYWESAPDRGQTHAINKGFSRATGEIIAYLNSDDRYCERVFERIAEYFTIHADCMWLAGNVLFTDEAGNVFSRKKPVFSPYVLRYGTSSVYQPAVFVRRRVLDEIGFLDEAFTAIMDQEWFCRIAEKYPPHVIDLDITFFRWHPGSKSSSGRRTRHYQRYVSERVMLARRYAPWLTIPLSVNPSLVLRLLAEIARVVKFWLRVKRIASATISHWRGS